MHEMLSLNRFAYDSSSLIELLQWQIVLATLLYTILTCIIIVFGIYRILKIIVSTRNLFV
jgi:hypothetical protein